MPTTTPDPIAARLSRTAGVFKLASDPLRLHILAEIAAGERHVTDLCAALGQTQPAVSHHLALLRISGLIEARREGKHNYYGLTDRGRRLAEMADAIGE